MLAPTHELIQRTAIYDDSTELADAGAKEDRS